MRLALADDDLLALWLAYETGDEPLRPLAARFGLSPDDVQVLAAKHRWQRQGDDSDRKPTENSASPNSASPNSASPDFASPDFASSLSSLSRDMPSRPVSWRHKPCPGLADCPERSELVAQSWALAQRQIEEIDQHFSTGDPASGDTAKSRRINPVTQARALGVVVRVLKDLVALDRAARAESLAEDPQDHVSSDGLRAELERRLDAIKDRQEDSPAPQS